ncbi:MAG: hypothetical protein WCT18_01990 [Patescibacteria group bacterium]
MLKIKTALLLSFIIAFCPIFASQAAGTYSGYILLQVESHGEAWYVYPKTNEKYYLGRPTDAYGIMRQLGLGITNANLAKIPIDIIKDNSLDSDRDELPDYLENALNLKANSADTDNDDFSDYEELLNGFNPNGSGKISFDSNLANKLKGQILIQVEKAGQAWYIYPKNGKRYFLGSATQAFNVMKNLGMGISNNDLNKITANYPKETLSIFNSYEISLPTNWTIANIFPSQEKKYFDLAIENETQISLPDNAGLLRIWKLSDVADHTLKEFDKSAGNDQEKILIEDFLAGIKPARSQEFHYLSNITIKNLGEFFKGARIYYDVMIDTNTFIHFDCAIFKQENIAIYKKTCTDLVKSFNIK